MEGRRGTEEGMERRGRKKPETPSDSGKETLVPLSSGPAHLLPTSHTVQVPTRAPDLRVRGPTLSVLGLGTTRETHRGFLNCPRQGDGR